MSSLTYSHYAGIGELARKTMHYSQAVRVGDRIEISGQGGWDPERDSHVFPKDLKAEYEQAFKNVDLALKTAGGKGWSQVFRVNSYHTNLEDTAVVTGLMIEGFDKWMPGHAPIWTEIGVKQLGAPDMHVEIEVVAYDPEGAKSA